MIYFTFFFIVLSYETKWAIFQFQIISQFIYIYFSYCAAELFIGKLLDAFSNDLPSSFPGIGNLNSTEQLAIATRFGHLDKVKEIIQKDKSLVRYFRSFYI